MSKKIILLAGPTASGKSKLAIYLAKKLNGEIINADSMQIYNEFSILSSRPNKKEEKSPKPVVKPKKPVRKTKKGGGKQPKQKKLNRRKQLEFRFDARAILDNSSVAEEHRSNIFGQIWAKGERIGIDSSIE